jgi:ABC-2 type transport system permease protein
MRRMATVAWREFRHTALTKGFLIAAVGVPLAVFLLVPLIPSMARSTPRPIEGTIVVIDGVGGCTAALQQALQAPAESIFGRDDPLQGPVEVKATVQAAAPDADETALRQRVARGDATALITFTRDADGEHAALVVPSASPPRHTARLESAARQAVVRARAAAAGQDYERLRTLMAAERVRASRISPDGAVAAESTELRILVPMGFMMLLWITVFTSANYLLTTTIEEKGSRVMEVLLSAVSPMELLAGKLLGQACVSLVMLAMYGAAGLSTLGALAMLDVVPLSHLLWFVVWFPIAYFMVAAIMGGIGAAVSDLREAQSLVGPAMMALMVPLVLWLPIVENPNGPLAVAFSFIPPASPFVNILRVTAASEPVPLWQSVAALATAIACVIAIVWAGARVFRVGVLMQGKTPTPRELLRWVRMR